MTSRNVSIFKVISILAAVILLSLFTLTGCGKPTWTPPPTSTPMPTATDTPTPVPTTVVISENSTVNLPDGSIVILEPGAEVEISELPGLPQESSAVKLLINDGEILIAPAKSNTEWMTVVSSKGYLARVKGCAMIINFNAVKDSFEVQCIGGECEIGKDADHLISAANNKTWLYQGGIYFEPVGVDFSKIYGIYGKIIPACVKAAELMPVTGSTPESLTPSATADTAATGTAACESFNKLFPATPCP